jgi:transposase-like protein
MAKNTIIDVTKPNGFSPDPLTDILRAGARELLATASHAELLDDKGRQRLVRHGFLPEREVMTGIGKVPVQVPRLRDRGANADGWKVCFNSSLVPPYLRKAKSVEDLLPWLYLKGILTGATSTRVWTMIVNVCWLLLALTNTETRTFRA